jgi:hypothetical protein
VAVRAAELGGQRCGVVVVIGGSAWPSWVGSGRVEEWRGWRHVVAVDRW